MWLDTGKPKSKRPRSKKDKQKLNSIVDRTSPCEARGKMQNSPAGLPAPSVVSKCVIPSTLSPNSTSSIITTTSAVFSQAVSSLPCSVSFLENPAVFVAQQTAIINNSLASCNIDLNSPTSAPSLYPKPSPNSASVVPLIKVEQDCGDPSPVLNTKVTEVTCKKEPDREASPCPSEDSKVSTDSSAGKVMCGCAVSGTNHNNNNKLFLGKTECDQMSPKVSSCSQDCHCGGTVVMQPSLQAKKKVSPKAKSRTKAVSAASKMNNLNPACLQECVSPAAFPPLAQPAVADPCTQGPLVGTVPLQLPDLSQVLVASGANNLNLLALQQALAQYSLPGSNASGTLGVSGNANTAPDFPASSLLTAAARGQLSQQTPLGPFLFPAILQASGMTGQDVSLVATAAMQQQLQQQQLQQQQLQQQQQQLQPQQVDPSALPVNSNAELNVKTAAALMAAGLIGVNPASNINQAGTLPLQLVPNGNMITTGMLPAAQFQNSAVLTPGLPSLQGLPLNVLLPVNQQLVGLGADPMQGISVDLSGNIVANVSVGMNVSKTLNISPKVVDSVAAPSPGGQALASPQMAGTTVKGSGSTVHHLPQHSISSQAGHGVHVAQNIGHSINQSFPQVQGINQQPLGQNTDGINVGGEAVMLNNLLPSILAFNAPMPPISLPMVTNVTNSLTQVIPAVGTTPALVAQQQQQQQQQATAQFLNTLALPAVAAATFTNPLLITSPLAPQTATTQLTPRSARDLNPEDKTHDLAVAQEGVEQEKTLDADQQKMDACDAECGEKDVDQNPASHDLQQQQHDPQQQQQQVLVLPGGGLPLMQVLNNPAFTSAPVDKLCNTTQLFLPAAAPQQSAATMPDLSQLGPVALTPLGIQQMWNSLNSLQLQQLQTLQLQQLVWQQLQGCIPHQVTTVDPSAAQMLPAQFFTHLQQGAVAQQQDQTSDAVQQHEEGMDMHQDAEMEKEGYEPFGSGAAPSPSKDKTVTDSSPVQESCELNVQVGSAEQLSPGNTRTLRSSSLSVSALSSVDNTSTVSLGSASRVQTVQPMVSSTQPKLSTAVSAQQDKLHVSDGLRTRLSTKAMMRSGVDSDHMALRSAVNGECSVADLHGNMSAGRQRVSRQGCSAAAPAKVLTNGPGSVALAGVVMSSPASNLIGQGPVKT